MAFNDMTDERALVRQIQHCLRLLSARLNEPALNVAEDGVYDTGTQDAVKLFQKRCGLEPTGTIDQPTWDALHEQCDAVREGTDPAEGIHPFWGRPGMCLEMGERSSLVYILKIMLNELKLFYDCYAYLPMNPKYDSATAEAVRQFQQASGLDPSGVVDRSTWNRLASEYDLAVREGGTQ